MHIIRASAYRRMPWKNGGGETIEVAISPQGVALDAFDWRVSMAHVASAGPFSAFPGVDRTLAVIEGAGIVLYSAGRGAVRLGPDSPPYAFPGDLAVDATLVDGPIDDLNVMTRRGRARHLLSRLSLRAPAMLPRHGETTIILARQYGAVLRAGAQADTLGPGDAVILEGTDPSEIAISPAGAGEYFAIDLWRSA